MATLMKCTQPYWAGNNFVPVGTVYPAGHLNVVEAFYEPFEVEEPQSREDLITEAEGLGVKVDRRWGDDRLRSEIESASAAKTAGSEEE